MSASNPYFGSIFRGQPMQSPGEEHYAQSRYEELLRQLASNAAQGIYNINNVAQAQQSVAGQQYNLAGDLANQQLRALGMQGDILRQQANNNQLTQGLGYDVSRAQTDLAQTALSNARYLRGQDEDLARLAYQRSISQVPSQAAQARRLLGY